MSFDYLATNKIIDQDVSSWFKETTIDNDPATKALDAHKGDLEAGGLDRGKKCVDVIKDIFGYTVSNPQWGAALEIDGKIQPTKIAQDLHSIAEKTKFYKEAYGLEQPHWDAEYPNYSRRDRTAIIVPEGMSYDYLATQEFQTPQLVAGEQKIIDKDVRHWFKDATADNDPVTKAYNAHGADMLAGGRDRDRKLNDIIKDIFAYCVSNPQWGMALETDGKVEPTKVARDLYTIAVKAKELKDAHKLTQARWDDEFTVFPRRDRVIKIIPEIVPVIPEEVPVEPEENLVPMGIIPVPPSPVEEEIPVPVIPEEVVVPSLPEVILLPYGPAKEEETPPAPVSPEEEAPSVPDVIILPYGPEGEKEVPPAPVGSEEVVAPSVPVPGGSSSVLPYVAVPVAVAGIALLVGVIGSRIFVNPNPEPIVPEPEKEPEVEEPRVLPPVIEGGELSESEGESIILGGSIERPEPVAPPSVIITVPEDVVVPVVIPPARDTRERMTVGIRVFSNPVRMQPLRDARWAPIVIGSVPSRNGPVPSHLMHGRRFVLERDII